MRSDRREFLHTALLSGAAAAAWPLARLGAQTEVVTKDWSKRTPSLPMRSMFGVFRIGLP